MASVRRPAEEPAFVGLAYGILAKKKLESEAFIFWAMRPLFFVFTILTTLAVCVRCRGQNEAALGKAVDYMASVLATGGEDQKILFGGDYRDEPCRLFVSDNIRDLLVKPSRLYATEVQFHLGTIDPKSIKVNVQKSTMVLVEFETTDYKPLVFESASKWKETKGRIPKALELFSVPTYRFRFLNAQAGNHFAKAFERAVELCGGKQSAF